MRKSLMSLYIRGRQGRFWSQRNGRMRYSQAYQNALAPFKIIKRFAKFRYVMMGTMIGTGSYIKHKIDEWTERLTAFPNMDKLKSTFNEQDWSKTSEYVKENISSVSTSTKNKLSEISNSVPMPDLKPLINFKEQLRERWENAKEAGMNLNLKEIKSSNEATINENNKKRIRELENITKELEKQNDLIKKELYGKKCDSSVDNKKTLVELYSEILDDLSTSEEGFSESDHLPKVVVVGDQSAGKTSVLEMLAQARICPRGGGQMMTRSPVKVTLCEGPFHVAQLQGSSREYDLNNEKHLMELRKNIEKRMLCNIEKGKSVSKNVISLTVKGPGLKRMVLIDLPGIISTQTVDMANDTKDLIKEMTQHFMNNPNAIILCIQDGSIDAERSNVTELVSQCDPTGKRTIFVLTKVDMAEKNIVNPDRIRQILSGKLFPMKALGYFAVVTGNGNKDDSIQNIKEYEQVYFTNSKLLEKGIIKPDQVTSENLSKAVAKCFWEMVEESVEHQYDVFKAKKFNIEAEWKNCYPRKHEMDRDELFYRAHAEILDQGSSLSFVSANEWEDLLLNELWKTSSEHVFENIYLPAGMSQDKNKFNTLIDISLKHWADKTLLDTSMECANKILKLLLEGQLFKEKSIENFDSVYENLKLYVFDETMKRHRWEKRSKETLQVLQAKTLQDRYLTQKNDWNDAITFLENSVKEEAEKVEKELQTLIGPTYLQRLYRWQSMSDDQEKTNAVKKELEMFLNSSTGFKRSSKLSSDEVIALRSNLETRGLAVDDQLITDTWKVVYRRYFLNNTLERAKACKKEFYLFSQEETRNQTDCEDVVLFWRIKQMLKVTSNVIRQQITHSEAQNIQNIIKEILKEVNRDPSKKRDLIVGKRVTLAEDLKQVRRILQKLEEFIKTLKNGRELD